MEHVYEESSSKVSEESKKSKSGAGWFRDIVTIIVTAIVFSFLLKTFIAQTFFVPSGSMENTLQVNDRIIANVAAKHLKPIERGDIVVFKDTQGWLAGTGNAGDANAVEKVLSATGITNEKGTQHLVKRVIGVAGDTIECCGEDGRVKVNGKTIDETYLKMDSSLPFPGSHKEFKITVPEGGVWVMGDNRNHSSDSRYHMDLPSKGVVREEDIVGPVSLIAWPLDRAGIIGSSEAVFPDAG